MLACSWADAACDWLLTRQDPCAAVQHADADAILEQEASNLRAAMARSMQETERCQQPLHERPVTELQARYSASLLLQEVGMPSDDVFTQCGRSWHLTQASEMQLPAKAVDLLWHEAKADMCGLLELERQCRRW